MGVLAPPDVGVEQVTVYTALNAVRAIVDPVIKAEEGVIRTHTSSCYQYHPACLAVLIRDAIDEEMKA